MLFHNHKASKIDTLEIVPLGLRREIFRDFYHYLLIAPWLQMILAILIVYLLINVLFALLYLAGGNCIIGARPGSLIDTFAFSVQTMSTIGYLDMKPQTAYAHMVVAAEGFVGLLIIAMITGLMFAKFSIPTAKVMFSNIAVIAPFNGIPTLIFRVANTRFNGIIEAKMRVVLIRNETTLEGEKVRSFKEMSLVVDQIGVLAMFWTLYHPITSKSPLYGYNFKKLKACKTIILAIISGTDSTHGQSIHATKIYNPEDLMWNARFSDILTALPNGKRAVDYSKFHDYAMLKNPTYKEKAKRKLAARKKGVSPKPPM